MKRKLQNYKLTLVIGKFASRGNVSHEIKGVNNIMKDPCVLNELEFVLYPEG